MASVNSFKFFVATSIFCLNSMKQFIQFERVLQLSWVTQIEPYVFNVYLARLRDVTCSKGWQWLLCPTYKTKNWLRIMYNRTMAIYFLLHWLQPVTRCLLKACVHYFLSNFYFWPNDSPSKTMKNVFLFHLKSSFHSQDIQIFVYSSSPPFFPVSHCFRGWFKKNLKVIDVITRQNKDLITHFVWYLEKEIRRNIETLCIDRVLNTEHFYRKIMQEVCTKS